MIKLKRTHGRSLTRQTLALLLFSLVLSASGCGDSSPTEPSDARITFNSTSCTCVSGSISLYVDDRLKGTMSCSSSKSYTLSPGEHTAQACDQVSCWSPASRYVAAGYEWTINLNCGGNVIGNTSESVSPARSQPLR